VLLASLHWAVIWDNRIALLHGLERTLKVSAIAVAGAFVVGIVLGAARAYRIPVISQLAAIYVEVIRNTPILVQIFFLFYGLPKLHVVPQPFTVAWLAVLVWGGAFNTENFRAGFGAVGLHYREAAQALGLGRLGTFLNVALPLGLRIALPSTINTSASVLKNTALMTAIGYAELTNTAYSIASVTFRDLEMYTVLGATYLALVWSLSGLIRLVERRLAIPEYA